MFSSCNICLFDCNIAVVVILLFSVIKMPFKFGMRRACRYAVSSKCAFIVCVHLLDRPLMDCVLTFESTGRDCLENVANRIQLTDVCCVSSVKKLQHNFLVIVLIWLM